MPESSERGALTEAVYYILLSAYAPIHGYAIMKNISKLSGGRVVLGPGTLYGAINTLVEKGWLTGAADFGDLHKKAYIITDSGKRVILREIERLNELLDNGRTITGSVSDENNN